MKSLFSAAATVLFTTTIAFSAMAFSPRHVPASGPSQVVISPETDTCTDNGNGTTTCCTTCGNKRCCATVGPIGP